MSNESLAVQIQNGNTELIPQLWEQCYGVFHIIANKYINLHGEQMTSAGVEKQDLIQECYFAMLAAIKSYNSEKPYKFTTYINKHAINRFNTLLGFRGKTQVLNNAYSLSVPYDSDNEESAPLQDYIPDKKAQNAFDEAEGNIYQKELQQAFTKTMSKKLSDFKRHCICLRYYDNMPPYKIDEHLGTSRDKVNHAVNVGLYIMAHDHSIKRLRYIDEITFAKAYRGVGVCNFKESGASNPERIAEMRERMLHQTSPNK